MDRTHDQKDSPASVSRLDAASTGQVFVLRMMALLVVVVVVYLVLHRVVREPPPTSAPGCTAERDWQCFAQVDALGDLQFVGQGDVDWYVGATTAAGVREQAVANSRTLDELRTRIATRAATHLAPMLLDRSPVDRLRQQVHAGRYDEATRTFDAIVSSLATPSANSRSLEIAELAQDLNQVVKLKREQFALARRLTPPVSNVFFWTSPVYSMLEVLFFSLFGVLTNLLVDAAEQLRRGRYQPLEQWVGYTKLLYGPLFAAVFVLAMINGLLGPESQPIRVWTLPLASFFFGYASRRIAGAIDRVLDRTFGEPQAAVARPPGPSMDRSHELVARLMEASRPTDFHQLRACAKELTREIVECEVEGRAGR